MTERDRILRYKQLVDEMVPDGVSPVRTEDLIDIGFFKAPASTKYHGNYEGGLFDHSVEVTKALMELSIKNDLQWETPDSIFMVGMFHDLCKVDAYEITPDGIIVNQDQILDGHGTKSVILLQKIAYCTLTMEEIACIRWHMGAYEKDTELWKPYGKAIERYRNVLWTHTADMIASKIVGV